jgi:hypothetical protein
MAVRRVSNRELADLPQDWENPVVDTRNYYQSAMEAYEVDEATYLHGKMEGCLCQKHQGKYYLGA